MSDTSNTLIDLLEEEVIDVLSPLILAVEDPYWFDLLFGQLGLEQDDSNTANIISALRAVLTLKDAVTVTAQNPSPSFAGVALLLKSARDAFTAVRSLSKSGGAFAAFEGLGEDLIQLLLAIHVGSNYPLLYHLCVLLTLIENADDTTPTAPVIDGDNVLRSPTLIPRFHLERLSPLFKDPVSLLRAEYVNSLATVDEANAMADKLFPRVASVLNALGIPNRYGIADAARPLLGIAAPLVDHSLLVYLQNRFDGATADAGFCLALSSADRGDVGLVVSPFGELSFTKQAGDWALEFDISAEVDAFAYGHKGFIVTASANTVDVTGKVAATLPSPSSGPAFILGSPNGSRLEVGGAQLMAETTLSEARQSLALSADVSSAAIVIAPGDGDSFLSSILPADGLKAKFDLGIAWSNERGFTFRGAAGLDATLPVGLSVGGVSVPTVHLGLDASDAGLLAEVSASVAVSIGPVDALVDRVGLTTAVAFPKEGGNLGVADLALGFKPPSGIGLSVDAEGVLTGGGFLFHDEAQELYAGAMQLSLHEEITLKAFGLIATRMPDGSRGYSLIVFITAEDFRPIPLGLGFTLLGIGGMVAVNRTFDQDVLRQGLKNGTLATLLFPRDPVGNSPTLISTLASVFPARRDSFLLGLLAKIGWFTPPLVLMDLALILEFGARERLLALGHISALLPSADNDLVRLTMEAMGVIDFDAGTVALDAILVDSRLAHKFPLTGSAALRAGFGSSSNATFVLSAGGFNPHFTPPAGFPGLERVAIALCAGDNPRLICEAYFAITANTVQFGARASLYAAAAGFSVEGDVGFDVLVQLAPLHFIADFDARLQLKCGSHNLFMVGVQGELEGPRPLRVSGKASFEILWCDFSVNFDATLVQGEPPPLPSAIDVLAQLTQALVSPASWSTRRTAAQPHGVALRSLPPASANAPLVLDPLGQLVVMQQVVPLNTGRDIELFGAAPVAGDRRFALAATLDGAPLAASAVQASFAPAQFFVMSDDEKLAAPSFESMDAGCVFGSATTVIDPAQVVAAPLQYQTIVIGVPPAPSATSGSSSHAATANPALPATAATPASYTLTASQLQSFSRSGAAARAPLRQVGRARFRNDLVKAGATLKPKNWTIMPKGDGPAATVTPSVRTWSEYQGALKAINRGGAHWQLLPSYELAV